MEWLPLDGFLDPNYDDFFLYFCLVACDVHPSRGWTWSFNIEYTNIIHIYIYTHTHISIYLSIHLSVSIWYPLRNSRFHGRIIPTAFRRQVGWRVPWSHKTPKRSRVTAAPAVESVELNHQLETDFWCLCEYIMYMMCYIYTYIYIDTCLYV